MNRRLSHAPDFKWKQKAPPPVKLDAYTAGGRACQRGELRECRLRGRTQLQWLEGWDAAHGDGVGD